MDKTAKNSTKSPKKPAETPDTRKGAKTNKSSEKIPENYPQPPKPLAEAYDWESARLPKSWRPRSSENARRFAISTEPDLHIPEDADPDNQKAQKAQKSGRNQNSSPGNAQVSSPSEKTIKKEQKSGEVRRVLQRPTPNDSKNSKNPKNSQNSGLWSPKVVEFPRERSSARSAALRSLKRSEDELSPFEGPHRVHVERAEWKVEGAYADGGGEIQPGFESA